MSSPLLATLCLIAALADPKTPSHGPIALVVGESIAKVKLGMELRKVMKMLPDLKPEGTRRGADRTSYVRGALAILVDESSRVISINVDLPKSAGLLVGKTLIPPEATLDEISKSLPRCELSNGSGGRVLECQGNKGKMHFYDSFSNAKAVWAILP
jgi:hypothetical protein